MTNSQKYFIQFWRDTAERIANDIRGAHYLCHYIEDEWWTNTSTANSANDYQRCRDIHARLESHLREFIPKSLMHMAQDMKYSGAWWAADRPEELTVAEYLASVIEENKARVIACCLIAEMIEAGDLED